MLNLHSEYATRFIKKDHIEGKNIEADEKVQSKQACGLIGRYNQQIMLCEATIFLTIGMAIFILIIGTSAIVGMKELRIALIVASVILICVCASAVIVCIISLKCRSGLRNEKEKVKGSFLSKLPECNGTGGSNV